MMEKRKRKRRMKVRGASEYGKPVKAFCEATTNNFLCQPLLHTLMYLASKSSTSFLPRNTSDLETGAAFNPQGWSRQLYG